jgi:multiple antibiotic resistance protein
VERQLLIYANAVLFTLGALLPIVNPLGSAPIFLSLTADLPGDARRRLAIVVARHAFLLLMAAMLIGSYVLDLFGISLPIVRVGGGLLVTANGWRMLNDDSRPSSDPKPVDTWEREVARRGFYPLTFPLTVGPGSISIAITLGARAPGRGMAPMGAFIADLIGVTIVALAVFLCYRSASRVIASLGETGTAVFLRLSSFILLCIGVSIMWSGIVDLITPLLTDAPMTLGDGTLEGLRSVTTCFNLLWRWMENTLCAMNAGRVRAYIKRNVRPRRLRDDRDDAFTRRIR